MQNCCQKTLTFSGILLVACSPALAMSKYFNTEASVTIVNNVPCVFIEAEKYGDEPVEGIQLVDDDAGVLWRANERIPSTMGNCLPLGGQGFHFKVLTPYTVKMGRGRGAMMYAYQAFCLGKNQQGDFYLAQGVDGKCTLEPQRRPKLRTWWQKLFD